jgi:hypothetical protein
MTESKEEITTLLCDCGSLEHQIVIIEDPEDNWIYVQIHLRTYRSFLKRLRVGIKYAFGYKCRFGEFDSIIIRREDHQKLINLLEKYK